jgi:hypothetical protein
MRVDEFRAGWKQERHAQRADMTGDLLYCPPQRTHQLVLYSRLLLTGVTAGGVRTLRDPVNVVGFTLIWVIAG